MTKKLVFILIGVIVIIILGIVILIRPNISDDFNEFKQQTDIIEQPIWESSGLDLNKVMELNKDSLDYYEINLSLLTEQDFYFSGTEWDAIVLSNSGVPFKVVISKDFQLQVLSTEDELLGEIEE